MFFPIMQPIFILFIALAAAAPIAQTGYGAGHGLLPKDQQPSTEGSARGYGAGHGKLPQNEQYPSTGSARGFGAGHGKLPPNEQYPPSSSSNDRHRDQNASKEEKLSELDESSVPSASTYGDAQLSVLPTLPVTEATNENFETNIPEPATMETEQVI